MIRKLENDFLVVEFSEKGAELLSIKSKKTGIEYLWQGNPEFWAGRAPILFPICGRLFSGKYVYNNKEYEMTLHGIARFFNFTVREISNEQIEFDLCSNEKTKESYPFDFMLTIRYVLKSGSLKTEFIVKNTGKEEMYFAYGGHPGFNVPFTAEESFEDYYLEFSQDSLQRIVFTDACLCSGNTEKYNLNKKKLKLTHDLFDNDALFFETESDKIKLKSTKSKNSLVVSYSDMTCVGIWHMPKTSAPYVCIEPWHGIPSDDGIVDDLKTKKQMINLSPNKKYHNSYTVRIIEN